MPHNESRMVLDRATLGELRIAQILDNARFEVLFDPFKSTFAGGHDLLAYDPRTRIVYVIDNKAYIKSAIRDAEAFSIKRLGDGNLDRIEKHLHETGSAAAIDAWHKRDVAFAISNAEAAPATRIRPAIFNRGWKVIDVFSGGIYGNLKEFQAARAGWIAEGAVVSSLPNIARQRGFATVGGMLFSVVAIGGVVYALSQFDDVADAKAFVASAVVDAGLMAVVGKLVGSVGMAAVIVPLLTVANDQGSPTREDLERDAVTQFMAVNFSNEFIRDGGATLRAEVRELLFNTPPLVLAPEPTRDGTVEADRALELISLLKAESTDDRVLLSAAIAAATSPNAQRIGDILRRSGDPILGNFLAVLEARLTGDWSAKVAKELLRPLDPEPPTEPEPAPARVDPAADVDDAATTTPREERDQASHPREGDGVVRDSGTDADNAATVTREESAGMSSLATDMHQASTDQDTVDLATDLDGTAQDTTDQHSSDQDSHSSTKDDDEKKEDDDKETDRSGEPSAAADDDPAASTQAPPPERDPSQQPGGGLVAQLPDADTRPSDHDAPDPSGQPSGGPGGSLTAELPDADRTHDANHETTDDNDQQEPPPPPPPMMPPPPPPPPPRRMMPPPPPPPPPRVIVTR